MFLILDFIAKNCPNQWLLQLGNHIIFLQVACTFGYVLRAANSGRIHPPNI